MNPKSRYLRIGNVGLPLNFRCVTMAEYSSTPGFMIGGSGEPLLDYL